MKKLTIIIGAFFACLSSADAQVSIDLCQQLARDNYPMIKQYELIEKTEAFNLSNANKNYLPQLSLSAKATYQSTVTGLPITVPGIDIKSMNKDQYNAELRLSQTIWDGGMVQNQKERVKASAEASSKELEANLYQIRNRINDLYFGILLLSAQLERNTLYQEELARNHQQVSSFIVQGIANQSDLDIVQVEILNSKQNHVQLVANKLAFSDMLSYFIGQPIDEATIFAIPSYENNSLQKEVRRPELSMYDAQWKELDIQRKGINTALMPKFELFATGGYGRPGLNMLKNKFEAYYIGGVRLAWNFGSLYTKGNDNKLIDIAQESLNVQREAFLFNTNIEIKQEDHAIHKNRELLKHDDEIIRLRTNIRKTAEIKLANGTISTTDFMREMTSENMAKQQKIEHEMELLMTIYQYKFITNQ